MKPNSFEISYTLAVMSILFNTSWASEVATNQENASKAERIPLIQIEGVPLTDGIRNLARQANLNCILDPRIVGPSGMFRKEPTLTVRWENITAEEALQKVLKTHQLTLVANPATTVARIIPANVIARPVPMSQLENDKTKPVTPINIDDVPLYDAIQHLARHSGLNVTIAPEIKQAMDRRLPVSVRWENITPRQGLMALLDNYDLILIEPDSSSAARVTLKTKAGKQ